MRRLWFALLIGCGDSSDGDSAGATTTLSTGMPAESSSGGASMSSTGAPACDMPPVDCTTCWECAQMGACKATYDACASNFECAGSLACIDYKCVPDGITQACADQCCQNCAEHFTCSFVDAMVTCVAELCSELCGPATCTG